MLRYPWENVIVLILSDPEFELPVPISSLVVMGLDMNYNLYDLGEYLIRFLEGKKDLNKQILDYLFIIDPTGPRIIDNRIRKNFLGHLGRKFKEFYPILYRNPYWIKIGLNCRTDDRSIILYRFAAKDEFTSDPNNYITIDYRTMVSDGLLLVNEYKTLDSIIKGNQQYNYKSTIRKCTYHLRGINVNTSLQYYIGIQEGVGSGISGWNQYDKNKITHFNSMFERFKTRHTKGDERFLIAIKLPEAYDFSKVTSGRKGKAELIKLGHEVFKYEEQGTYTGPEYNIKSEPGKIKYFRGGDYIPNGGNPAEIDLVGNDDITCFYIKVENADIESAALEDTIKMLDSNTYADKLLSP